MYTLSGRSLRLADYLCALAASLEDRLQSLAGLYAATSAPFAPALWDLDHMTPVEGVSKPFNSGLRLLRMNVG